MIEEIKDKYIEFNYPFTSEDGLYSWIQGVKYGLMSKDDKFYYIYRKDLPPYKLSKELEDVIYEIKDKQYDNKR